MSEKNHAIQVLAAHTYPAFAGGIKLNLRHPKIKIEIVYSKDEIIKQLRGTPFSVLFLHDAMPGTDNTFRKSITRSFPQLKVIILTGSADKKYIQKLFAEGALGCMHLTAGNSEYRQAVKKVIQNQRICCSFINNLLLAENAALPPSEESIAIKAGLTKRQAEILPYLIKKISEKEIAKKFFISEKTLPKHRKNIRKKIDAIDMLYLVDNFIKPL